MKNVKRTLLFTLFNMLFILQAHSGFAQITRMDLLGQFEEGWQKDWMERKLSAKPTKYEVVTDEDSNQVLRATSIESASGLWRMLEVRPGRIGRISWKWKIDKTLVTDTAEKTKRGDDYVARLFVVFEPHFVSWKTQTICYVWAAKEPVGSIYHSPYAKSVGTIVVQSGNENRGKWISEERDFVADYKKVFGRQPEMVTAVAIMVDTDNSHQEALTWFDDIKIEFSDPAEEGQQKKPGILLNN